MATFEEFFQQLLDESPMIQKMREKWFEEGFEKGFEEGRVIGLRRVLVENVQAEYPDLAEFAQQQASRFDKSDALKLLIKQVMTAPDASTVRALLEADTEIQGQ